MFTTLAVIALVHVVALGVLLLSARYDSQLVDEEGRPTSLAAVGWKESVVPAGPLVSKVPAAPASPVVNEKNILS